MPIDQTGIRDHRLTKEEFELLGFLDARLYLSSSVERFEDWDVSFSTTHPDWQRRVDLQRDLAELFGELVAAQPPGEPSDIVFLGASRGSIATYFHLGVLARIDRLDDFHVHIVDYLWEPLELTKRGDFTVSEQAERDIGFDGVFGGEDYKRELAGCTIAQANIVELPFEDDTYDVVVAPFIHHHLNYLDKERACAEMVRVTKPGGLCLVGDLTFDHRSFSSWLAEHEVEEVPYALESFIPLERHAALLPGVTLLDRRQASFYYVFAARKDGG